MLLKVGLFDIKSRMSSQLYCVHNDGAKLILPNKVLAHIVICSMYPTNTIFSEF